MTDNLKLILSYRKNEGTERKPVWGDWKWTVYCPIDFPDGIVQLTQKYNWERHSFSSLEYKLEAGYLGNGGTVIPAEIID